MSARIWPFVFTMLLAADLRAAEFIFVNGDGAGEGLNDLTAVAPVGGNPGTTLGAQRLAALQRVGEIWGSHLSSPVPIRVLVGFDPLGSGILAGAGPVSQQQNFANAPKPNMWYSVALANSLAGIDLEPGSSDINVTANASAAFYYGLDGETLPGSSNFVDVVLHELGHGLGFISMIDGATGDLFGGQVDIFSSFIYDKQLETAWSGFTPAQRVTSAKNDPWLVWTGPFTTAGLPSKFSQFQLTATLPGPTTQLMPISPADITPILPRDGLSGELVITDVGAGPLGGPNGACGTILNASQVAGKIAFVRRGDCTFAQKIYNAQLAGAIAVVIANNTSGVIVAGGYNTFNGVPLAIPAVMVSKDHGDLLLAASPGVQLSFTPIASSFPGTTGNLLRLYAPPIYASGSSISHWSTSAYPNLLMEPSISSNIDRQLDLTLTQLKDIGWKVMDIPFPHLTYHSWKTLVFTNSDTLINPTDDPDADGVKNQEEYFFGMNPKSPDVAKLPVFRFTNGQADLVFTRSKLTTDLAYGMEKSTTLGLFQPAVVGVDYQILSTVSLGTDAEQITLRLLNPPAKLFLRLRIAKNP